MHAPEFNIKRFSSRISVVTPEDLQRWRSVFTRQPTERTDAQLAGIDYSLSGAVAFFRKLPPQQRMSVYRICRFERLAKGKTLFRQGDVGDRFYIIVSGLVNVNVSVDRTVNVDDLHKIMDQMDTTEDSAGGMAVTTINTLGPLQTFGEMALHSEDGLRQAGISAAETTELLSIHGDEYRRIQEQYRARQLVEALSTMRRTTFFAEWPDAVLWKAAAKMKRRVVAPGHNVAEQGSAASHMSIITVGRCTVLRNVRVPASLAGSIRQVSAAVWGGRGAGLVAKHGRTRRFSESTAASSLVHYNEEGAPARRMPSRRVVDGVLAGGAMPKTVDYGSDSEADDEDDNVGADARRASRVSKSAGADGSGPGGADGRRLHTPKPPDNTRMGRARSPLRLESRIGGYRPSARAGHEEVEIKVVEYGKFDVFGLTPHLFEEECHIYTLRADTRVELLELPAADVEVLLGLAPKAAVHEARQMAVLRLPSDEALVSKLARSYNWDVYKLGVLHANVSHARVHTSSVAVAESAGTYATTSANIVRPTDTDDQIVHRAESPKAQRARAEKLAKEKKVAVQIAKMQAGKGVGSSPRTRWVAGGAAAGAGGARGSSSGGASPEVRIVIGPEGIGATAGGGSGGNGEGRGGAASRGAPKSRHSRRSRQSRRSKRPSQGGASRSGPRTVSRGTSLTGTAQTVYTDDSLTSAEDTGGDSPSDFENTDDSDLDAHGRRRRVGTATTASTLRRPTTDGSYMSTAKPVLQSFPPRHRSREQRARAEFLAQPKVPELQLHLDDAVAMEDTAVTARWPPQMPSASASYPSGSQTERSRMGDRVSPRRRAAEAAGRDPTALTTPVRSDAGTRGVPGASAARARRRSQLEEEAAAALEGGQGSSATVTFDPSLAHKAGGVLDLWTKKGGDTPAIKIKISNESGKRRSMLRRMDKASDTASNRKKEFMRARRDVSHGKPTTSHSGAHAAAVPHSAGKVGHRLSATGAHGPGGATVVRLTAKSIAASAAEHKALQMAQPVLLRGIDRTARETAKLFAALKHDRLDTATYVKADLGVKSHNHPDVVAARAALSDISSGSSTESDTQGTGSSRGALARGASKRRGSFKSGKSGSTRTMGSTRGGRHGAGRTHTDAESRKRAILRRKRKKAKVRAKEEAAAKAKADADAEAAAAAAAAAADAAALEEEDDTADSEVEEEIQNACLDVFSADEVLAEWQKAARPPSAPVAPDSGWWSESRSAVASRAGSPRSTIHEDDRASAQGMRVTRPTPGVYNPKEVAHARAGEPQRRRTVEIHDQRKQRQHRDKALLQARAEQTASLHTMSAHRVAPEDAPIDASNYRNL